MDFISWFESILNSFSGVRQTAPTPAAVPAPAFSAPIPPPSQPEAPQTMSITQQQLHLIMPHLDPGHASIYIPYLNNAMNEGEINTAKRMAAFLAEISEESGELRWWHEFASGQEYEGRRDLGNTQPGDGPRFKGRGPIQLTGRANYTAAARDLGVDIVANPDLVAGPQVGFRTTVWYWKNHGLNLLADVENLAEITRRINGGETNEDVRMAYYTRAKTALGIS